MNTLTGDMLLTNLENLSCFSEDDEDSSQVHSQEEEDSAQDVSDGDESSDESNEDDASHGIKKPSKKSSSIPKRFINKSNVNNQTNQDRQRSNVSKNSKQMASRRKKQTAPISNNETKISSSSDDSSSESDSVIQTSQTRKRKINTDDMKGSKVKIGVGGTKNIMTALHSLYDQIIEKNEDTSNSLLAALLKASVPLENNRVMMEYSSYLSEVHVLSWPVTPYTPQLYDVARRMIRLHNEDPNEAQIQLINLIFRSVGGTGKTNLSSNICLDHLDDSKWKKLIKIVIDDIEYTPIQHVLICADPLGAVHASSIDAGDVDEKHSSVAVREFRKIFEEFWYVLGVVALTEGNMSAKHNVVEDDEDEEEAKEEDTNKKRKLKNSSSKKSATTASVSTYRFDADLVGEIMNRLLNFTTHRCLDLRAAATVAMIHLGLAVADRTVLLGEKLNIATRQYNSAVAGSANSSGVAGGRKTNTEALRHVVDSLKRTRKDLEEVLTKNLVDRLLLHRYRDSNSFIRMMSIESLGRLIIQRPDLFLYDRYLKYFGWMLSDKSDRVRAAAIDGLLGPFTALQNTKLETRVIEMDLRQMENLAIKFINRLADCVVDVNVNVQEKALTLLLFLLKEGFLEEVEDDNLWNQINLRAIAPDASPKARMDALYFVIEQLEVFDDGANDNSQSRARIPKPSRNIDDRTISQRLDAIASWIANALVDGPIPLDKIEISRVDYVVKSLRNMPEHKCIVTKWPILLNAMKDDSIALTLHGESAGDRVDSAKQRVLVEMFVCSVLAEFEDGSTSGISAAKKKNGSKTMGDSSSTLEDSLSLYLIQSLAGLLAKFKSDLDILPGLVTLPQYLRKCP